MASPWDAILQGRNPFGTAGINIERAFNNYNNGMNAQGQGRGFWDPNLSRYGQLDFSQAGSEAGSDMAMFRPTHERVTAHGRINDGSVGGLVQIGDLGEGGMRTVIDPSQVRYDPEFGLVTSYENINQDPNWAPWTIAAIGAGGMAAQGAGLLGAGGDTASVMAAAPGQGYGTALGTGAANAGTVGTAAGGLSGNSGLLGPEIDPGLLGNINYTSPATATPSLASAPSITGANSGFLSNVMNGNFSGAAGNAANWAMSNPLQALGAGQTAVGLLGGGSDSGSNQAAYTPRNLLQDSKGGQGAPTQGNQGFYVNPHTLAQLRAYGGM